MTTYNESAVLGDPFDIHTPQALVSITVATTAVVLYSVTLGNTAKIKTLVVTNRNVASGFLRIGRTAAGFVQVFPDIWIPAGLTLFLHSEDLPDYWFREYNDNATDIVVESTVAAVAPNDIQVFCDVVEKGLG